MNRALTKWAKAPKTSLHRPGTGRGRARRRTLYLLVGLLPALVAGCAGVPTYQVQIDSQASPAAAGKRTYILLAGNKNVSGSNPRFEMFGGLLVRALRAHGMVLRHSEAKADVAVLLYYFIGDPRQQQYSYTVPVAHKHTYSYTVPSESTEFCYGVDGGCDTVTTYEEETHHGDYYTYDSEQRTGYYNTYLRAVRVVAIDLRAYHATGKAIVLWQTDIVSRGESADLVQVFPALLAAAEPYLATDAGKGITVSLAGDDPRVRAIEGTRP